MTAQLLMCASGGGPERFVVFYVHLNLYFESHVRPCRMARRGLQTLGTAFGPQVPRRLNSERDPTAALGWNGEPSGGTSLRHALIRCQSARGTAPCQPRCPECPGAPAAPESAPGAEGSLAGEGACERGLCSTEGLGRRVPDGGTQKASGRRGHGPALGHQGHPRTQVGGHRTSECYFMQNARRWGLRSGRSRWSLRFGTPSSST